MPLKIFKPPPKHLFPFSKSKVSLHLYSLFLSFFSTPKLHSHYLTSPPKLRCQTSPISTRPTFVSSENPKIVSPFRCFQPLATMAFSPLPTPKIARRFSCVSFLFIFCIFHILFVCFFFFLKLQGSIFL